MPIKNNPVLHFTAGTPARVVLQILGLSFLTFSISELTQALDTITLAKGILFFVAGCVVFLLREHVSNSDYFKEFAKYAETNLVFEQSEAQLDDEEMDEYMKKDKDKIGYM